MQISFQKSLSFQSTFTTPKKGQQSENNALSDNTQQYLQLFVSQNLAKQESNKKQKINYLQNRIKILEDRISQLEEKNFELTEKYLIQQEKYKKVIQNLTIQNNTLKNKFKALSQNLRSDELIISQQKRSPIKQKDYIISLHDLLQPIENLKQEQQQQQNHFNFKRQDYFSNHNQQNSCLNSLQTLKYFPNKNISDFKAYQILQKENQELKKMLRKIIFDKNNKNIQSKSKSNEKRYQFKTPQIKK